MNWFDGILERTGRTDRNSKNIWAIGSGKGGVGKSFLAVNLGILLSKRGKKVLLVDCDLGAANLHTLMGIERTGKALSGYLKGEIMDIQAIITDTSISNLEIISGARDTFDVADLNGRSIFRLEDALKNVDYDFVLVDTGAGTSAKLLDIFLMGSEGILITTPEPTSIENTYRFLKCVLLRKIRRVLETEKGGKVRTTLRRLLYNEQNLRKLTVAEIFEGLKNSDEKGENIVGAILGDIEFYIVINQVKRAEDREIGNMMQRICKDYFGIKVEYLGCISYEDSIGRSVCMRKPFVVYHNDSESVRELESCLNKLLNKRSIN